MQLERELNANYLELCDPDAEGGDGMDFVLTHQMRRLGAIWEKMATGQQWGTIAGVRVREGRDRKKANAFERG